MDPEISPREYLRNVRPTAPSELHHFFTTFEDLYNKKLWHQLTLSLIEFVGHPLSPTYQLELFKYFVRDFEAKLNQLRLVELSVKICKQLDDPNEVLEFLSSLLSRINQKKAPEAYILLLSSLAHAKLLFGDLEGTKTDIDECAKLLADRDSVEKTVNASFYSVAANYYKAKADYGPYYKHSLLYLACVNPDTDLDEEERLLRAHDLAISAFLGDTIYNFGELLMHPILDSLDNTPHTWIKTLLITFNEGNIGKFEALSPLFPQEAILQENHGFLRQKICLMALIESVFKRSADNRTMTFQNIAEETRLPLHEVEHLVMKALSLNLIQGSIDQVEEKAHIVWVQPRVLSRGQIGQLASRLTAWVDKLDNVEKFITTQTPELFV